MTGFEIFGLYFELQIFDFITIILSLFLIVNGIKCMVTKKLSGSEGSKLAGKYTEESIRKYATINGVMEMIIGIVFFANFFVGQGKIGGPEGAQLIPDVVRYIIIGVFVVVLLVFVFVFAKKILVPVGFNAVDTKVVDEVIEDEDMQE